MVREPNLAEDIAHDAFANVYKRLESLTNPSGYLRSTLTNTVFERSRQSGREKRRIRLITATEPTHVEQPSGGLSTRHQTNQIGTFDRSMVGVDPIDNHRPERSGRCHVSGEVGQVPRSIGPRIITRRHAVRSVRDQERTRAARCPIPRVPEPRQRTAPYHRLGGAISEYTSCCSWCG